MKQAFSRRLTLVYVLVMALSASAASAADTVDLSHLDRTRPETYFKMPNAGATAEIRDTNFFGWFWSFFD